MILAAFALIGAPSAAHAARPGAPTAVITLDPNDTGLDLAPTAADWSKRTGVQVLVGSCDGGLYCVEFSKDECYNSPAGCAWVETNAAGLLTCHVSIVEYGWDYWLTVFVTSHEVGHCLTWIGGAGFFHIPEEERESILNPTGARQTMRENQTRVNTADRKMIYQIFSGAWVG